MKFPLYCIKNGKVVKATRTWRDRIEFQRYCPESDDFKLDMQFLEHIYIPTETWAFDTEIVSRKKFNAYADRLRIGK